MSLRLSFFFLINTIFFSSSYSQEKPYLIIVSDLKVNANGLDPKEGETVAQSIRVKFTKINCHNYLSILNRDQANKVNKDESDKGKTPSMYDYNSAIKQGKLLSANYVIIGQINSSLLYYGYKASCTLVNIETGETVIGDEVDINTKSDIYETSLNALIKTFSEKIGNRHFCLDLLSREDIKKSKLPIILKEKRLFFSNVKFQLDPKSDSGFIYRYNGENEKEEFILNKSKTSYCFTTPGKYYYTTGSTKDSVKVGSKAINRFLHASAVTSLSVGILTYHFSNNKYINYLNYYENSKMDYRNIETLNSAQKLRDYSKIAFYTFGVLSILDVSYHLRIFKKQKINISLKIR